ncbi:hypothetical protein [Oceanobacillus sp. CAU 1775]
MKKLLTKVVLGTVLAAGLFFTFAPQAEDLTFREFGGEIHPPIFIPTDSSVEI